MEILADSVAKIYGGDYFDLGTVTQTFAPGLEIAQTPLSPEEIALAQAKARGEFPIYRVNSAPDGSPLTMYRMVQGLQEWFQETGHGKILYDISWYQDEAFFMEDTPRPGLALVSKAPISRSLDRNYHRQTQRLSELVGEIYEGREVPAPYQEALDEWMSERARLERILTTDRKGAAKGLAELQIQQLREKPVEVLQTNLVIFKATKERRLENRYTWTNAVSSGGHLVCLGPFDPYGASVFRCDPSYDDPAIGVCSSRSFI